MSLRNALDALIETKLGSNQQRWKTAAKDQTFQPRLPRVIIVLAPGRQPG